MTTKLTLTVEKTVIEQAKVYTKKNRQKFIGLN